MSIQTTVFISREDAEIKAFAKYAKILAEIKTMSDDDLEDLIDETFYNYDIMLQ